MNKKEKVLTQERLKYLFNYNAETGIFTRLITTSSNAKAGTSIHKVMPTGYLRVMINGESYYLHRLAWFYIHGIWPKPFIDHINHDRADNRIINLREATPLVNNRNFKDREYKTHFCICGKEITIKRRHCSQECNLRNKQKVDWESVKDELIHLKDIEKLSYVNIGKYYNVSDNTVSKWYKKFKAD